MTGAAEAMMLLVGQEYERSRFPPIDAWTVDGLRHEQKLKFELQAVGLLRIDSDGSCRLTSAGKDWIMWRRRPDPAPPLDPGSPMSRAAEWMMNRLALAYQQAGHPPRETWLFPSVGHDPVYGELRSRGLLESQGAAGPQATSWRLTEEGLRWVTARVQV